MQWLINFFTDLSNILSGVINVVISLVKVLVTLITSLPAYISTLTSCVGYLPEVLITWFGLCITVTVIFLILGRRQGGD